MNVSPRLLFALAGLAFAALVLWPGSAERAVAQARAVVGKDKVVMFSTRHCGYCERLRRDLRQAGIPWTERDIEASTANYNAWRALGGRGVPLTLVGETVVNGYNPGRILELARRP
ncbi:MAG: glutaredoxin family protein [Xanthomonadales bacterium]|nr:glutaredoxin family protein [Xanthomonadales bacterium]